VTHIRTCPECGEEFRPEIVRCSDCGALLEDRHDDVPPRETTEPPEPESEGDYSPVFTAIESEAMRDAAASLAAEGILFRATGSALGFQILVRSEDRAQAITALGGREGAVLFEPESVPSPGQDGGPCPACGAYVAAGAVECPECQLVLGEARGTCHSCGAAVATEATLCAFCGAAQ
jgi:predicted amidophosphoribosyltransferase